MDLPQRPTFSMASRQRIVSADGTVQHLINRFEHASASPHIKNETYTSDLPPSHDIEEICKLYPISSTWPGNRLIQFCSWRRCPRIIPPKIFQLVYHGSTFRDRKHHVEPKTQSQFSMPAYENNPSHVLCLCACSWLWRAEGFRSPSSSSVFWRISRRLCRACHVPLHT